MTITTNSIASQTVNDYESVPDYTQDDEFDEIRQQKNNRPYPVNYTRRTTTHIEQRPSGRARKKNYVRKRITTCDLLVLVFLFRFRFMTARQCAIMNNVKHASGQRRMSQLAKMGLIAQVKIASEEKGYALTTAGARHVIKTLNLPKAWRKCYKAGDSLSFYHHHIGISQVVAVELSGHGFFTGIKPPPAFDKTLHKSRHNYAMTLAAYQIPQLLKLFVSEKQLQSSWATQIKSFESSDYTTFENTPQGKARLIHRKFEQLVHEGRLPVTALFNMSEISWVSENVSTYNIEQSDIRHTVDLIVNMEHLRTSIDEPVSIGVEVELTRKKIPEYMAIFELHYESSRRSKRFKHIAWVVDNAEVEKTLRNAINKWLEEKHPNDAHASSFFKLGYLPTVEID